MTETIKISVNKSGQKGLFVTKNFNKGEALFQLAGEVSTKPTKYTIQISPSEHIDDPLGHYLNHSCDPNTYISPEDKTVRALEDIAAEEELFFDYNENEYEMATPFVCHCGAEKCRGEIKGNKFDS
jgi:hypothetical protein